MRFFRSKPKLTSRQKFDEIVKLALMDMRREDLIGCVQATDLEIEQNFKLGTEQSISLIQARINEAMNASV